MARAMFACPACGTKLQMHKSVSTSGTCRLFYLRCTADRCGWTGIGHAAIDRTISPGLIADQPIPAIHQEAIDVFLSALDGSSHG